MRSPRRSAFPGAEATWSAELPLSGGDLQTAIVSHRMHASFFAANSLDMPRGARLNSACFSQKLLMAVLLHHRDSFGFRIPPALAPTLGVVMAGPCARGGDAGLEHLTEADRIVRLDGGDPLQEMVRRGAAWAIQRVEPSKRRRSGWRPYSRRSPDSKPRVFDDTANAIDAAAREADALARDMRRQSRAQAKTLEVAKSRDGLTRAALNPEHTNVAAPCCGHALCETALVEESAWIPKLLTAGIESRQCLVCDAPTRDLLIFEREERYTHATGGEAFRKVAEIVAMKGIRGTRDEVTIGPEVVHEFWFGGATAENYRLDDAMVRWFRATPDFDVLIRSRFAASIRRAEAGEYDSWCTSARGRTSLIVLLDQLPRNAFRGTPNAFASDEKAREVCLDGVANAADRVLTPVERHFFYLPLLHSEKLADQEQSVTFFQRLRHQAPARIRRTTSKPLWMQPRDTTPLLNVSADFRIVTPHLAAPQLPRRLSSCPTRRRAGLTGLEPDKRANEAAVVT